MEHAAEPLRLHDGPLNRIIALPDRVPGPPGLWLLGLLASVVLVGHALVWATGDLPAGQAADYVLGPAVLFVFCLGLIRAMRRIGHSAFDDFRPALGHDDGEANRLRWELTRLPDSLALAAMALATVLVGVFATAAEPGDGTDSTPIAYATTFALWWLTVGGLALAMLYAVRQLRWVSRLYGLASRVDIFNTGPLNALSRLTATSGLGILVVAPTFLLPADEGLEASETLVSITTAVGLGLIALAVVSFVTPLRGMHARLVAEKGRLLRESTDRIRGVLALIHETVDTREFAKADRLQATLTSLLAEREVLSKLPTWPWSPGLLRGFATAALLPVVLWLVFRVLERIV